MKKTSRSTTAEDEQSRNMSSSFRKVLDLSSGDAHSAGMKPITFARQVIAGCMYPTILCSDALPPDAQLRAQTFLQSFDGGSAGSYTDSCGMLHVRKSIAKFISQRDGGIPSKPENIFITLETQRALMVMMRMLCQTEGVSSVMIPDPAPLSLTRLLERVGMAPLPYRLWEESGWSLERAELNRVIREARGRSSPRAIYISNPGDPTGHVQSPESIQDVIRFAADEGLFLLVNEAFQDTLFGADSEFVSYKRVLTQMEDQCSGRVQLASLHSLSNGIMGECGFRTGFMELVNVDEEMLLYTEVLLTGDLCPPVIGQIALDVMVAPPLPGEPSYSLYTQEVSSRLITLESNMSRAVKFLNDLPGFSCQSVQSGIFIYPQLTLPHSIETHSQSLGLLYSRRLLEDQGVCVGFSEDHTHSHNCCHFRMCVLMSSDELEEVFRRLQCFHLKFLKANKS